MKRVATAAVFLAMSGGNVFAGETGTAQLIGAAPTCFQIYVQESGTKYAVGYGLTNTAATIGFVAMLADYAGWTTLTINTDGTQLADCGDGTFYRITGVYF